MMNNRDDTILKLGLSFTPGVNAEIVRRLGEAEISLEDFFELPTSELSNRLGARIKLEKVKREEALFRAREERKFIDRHGIKFYFLGDDNYPYRLREIPDAPVVFYQLGETDLDVDQIISIVGTRRNTPYSTSFTEKFIKELSEYFPEAVIVSGLAYGIDSLAHRGALDNNVPTIGVVAHGLHTLYPSAHRDLAGKIIKRGGSLITEYPSGTAPYQRHFLERNRIVAALSDLTLVVESPIKGGAMSTANMAFSYSREVGAVPGRVSDPMSEGCNLLIRQQKASLVTGVADVIELTGWQPAGVKVTVRQRNLFPELSGESGEIYNLLRMTGDPMTIDAIFAKTGIKIPLLTSTLTEMEFDGIVFRHPGNRYSTV